jgi:hypothetical protein
VRSTHHLKIEFVKRSPMFPFIDYQKLSRNDKLQSIEMKGIQAIYLNNLTIMDKMILCVVYQDRRGE